MKTILINNIEEDIEETVRAYVFSIPVVRYFKYRSIVRERVEDITEEHEIFKIMTEEDKKILKELKEKNIDYVEH